MRLAWLWAIGAILRPIEAAGRVPNVKLSDDIPLVSAMTHIFDEINQLQLPASPCSACKHLLGLMKRVAHHHQDLMPVLLEKLCLDHEVRNKHHESLCASLHLYSHGNAQEVFSFLPDLVAMLTMMNPAGPDAEYFCHYMMAGSCSRPETRPFDVSKWWPPKSEAPRAPLAKSQGRTMKVLHLSDVHLSINYTQGSAANCLGAMCCDHLSFQDPTKPRIAAPKWGHYHCDCPQALLDDTLRNSMNSEANYTFALFTGDMVDHNPVFINKHDTLLEEEMVLRSLKRELGGIPVYPVLGNHDSYPYAQNAPPGSRFAGRTSYNIDLMEELCADWLGPEASKQLKTMFGAYVVHPMPGLKVISLNSNYYYRWNFYNYANTWNPDPSGALRFLVDELLECERQGTKAWIQAHVPPGGVTDEALPPASALLTQILERFSDNIAGIFFGHTHFDEFTVLYSNNADVKTYDNAINVAWVAPSVTPLTDLNPSWRWYEVDADTFEIMDSVTHYAPIHETFGYPEWDLAPDLEWRHEYSARSAYGTAVRWPETEPLNGRFWHLVAAEILELPRFAQRFVDRAYRYSVQTPACTSHECRAEHYCFATSMSVDQVTACHAQLEVRKNKRAEIGGVPTWPMPRSPRHALENVTSPASARPND